jgi:hypothetical protein
VNIVSVQPLKYTATDKALRVPGEEVEDDRENAEQNGLIVVGDIHTHPDWTCENCGHRFPSDCAPSETDWMDVKEPHFGVVVGICVVKKNKVRLSTRIRFYPAQPPIELKVCKK